MDAKQHEVVDAAMGFILPNIPKGSKEYRAFSNLIVKKLTGEHQCAILWNRDKAFVSLLKKHKIPLSYIGNKEVTIGNYYVRVRKDFHDAKETVLYMATTA